MEKEQMKKIKDNYSPVPTILQMESTECGAASLAMVLASYKVFVPLEKLRISCGINRDGSKAGNIAKAARTFGLRAQGYKMETEKLFEAKMPCILHWNFSHFVVLEGFKRGKVYLNDPASGKRIVSLEELDESFTGVVVGFEKSEDFQTMGIEPKLYKALFKRLKGSKMTIVIIFLIGLFLVIPGIITPAFSKIFIDDILIDGRDTWLRGLVWGMVLTGTLQAVLTYFQGQYLLKLQTKIAIINSGQFLWHVLRLPSAFFSQRYAGDLSQRMGSNDKVAQFLAGQLATTALNCVMLVFYLILMGFYSMKLAGVALVLACINMAYLKYVSHKREDQNSKLQQDSGKMMGTAMGGIQIIETIKSCGSEGDFFAKIVGHHAKSVSQQQIFGVSSQYLNTLPSLLTALGDAAVLIIGGMEVMGGVMTVGALIAFRSLMGNFMSPITSLMQIGTQYQEMKADINRLDDVLNYETDPMFKETLTEEEMLKPENNRRLKGYIDIENISFGYSPLDPPLIENFSLHIKPGQKVALVGSSGSGKSTVGKLICGIYEPWSGEIKFDGVGRQDIPRNVITNSVSVVDQEICLFADTIKNNLTLWEDAIPEEMILEAVDDAEIGEAIIGKQGGFRYKLEEGGKNLSGGQRQRLEIARALIDNPSILVMDEATSALDTLTEQNIVENINKRGCSCVIVAHRLSTIRDCDEIIVLEYGKIVQRGTHEELSKIEGPYLELVKTI